MAISDITRLARIDEQLLELEYLYTRELMREKELNKKNLLTSNGFKYRIDNLRRARQKLKQAMVQAPTKRMNYSYILASKKNKVIEAEAELEYIEGKYVEVMAKLMINKDDNTAQEALDLAAEIKVQQRRIKKYEDAVTRFIEHGSLLQERKVHSREALNYNPEKDAKRILQESKNSKPTIESILGNDPNWNLSGKPPENNAGDLLMPKQRVVIDFDE
jgi:hypothetical protein